MAATGKRMLSRIKAGRRVAVALLILGGILVVDRAFVGATDEFKVTGTLSLQPEGNIVVTGASGTYGAVGRIDLSAFVGRTVKLEGPLEEGAVYVSELKLGTISLEVLGDKLNVKTTAVVKQAADGFQITAEGLTFALVGSDELDQVVGRTATIDGDLLGSEVTLTRLRTTDGTEVDIRPPEVEDEGGPPPDESNPYLVLDED
jgi:hypothetical protein